MGLPIFEIQKETESQIFHYLENKGYTIKADGKAKTIEEGIDRGWLIMKSGKEVLAFGILDTYSGKKVFIFGPLHDNKHKGLWDLLVEEIPKLGGKRLKGIPC